MVEARLYCETVIKKNIYDKDKIKTVIILQFPYLGQKIWIKMPKAVASLAKVFNCLQTINLLPSWKRRVASL